MGSGAPGHPPLHVSQSGVSGCRSIFAPRPEAILSAKEPAQPPRPYTGIQYVSIPEFPAIGHKVGEEISQALTGKITVEQALGDAQTWVAQQMEASGYIGDAAKASP